MAWNKKEVLYPVQIIPFSAFWLRSSVVSVLISLISDTWANGPHDIKLIFLGGEGPLLKLASGAFSRVAHALHYCTGLAHPTNPSSILFFFV
ncbi:unnamed protein product [Linum tenue]|uniref:Uncharacterized protein n=1 Tax=Linum tenue TaxID=586396 RepID=A0AAV0P6N1_9ROSI|nr:unnamed protein product [Linum tenue]